MRADKIPINVIFSAFSEGPRVNIREFPKFLGGACDRDGIFFTEDSLSNGHLIRIFHKGSLGK
jgi:hypothetical protein